MKGEGARPGSLVESRKLVSLSDWGGAWARSGEIRKAEAQHSAASTSGLSMTRSYSRRRRVQRWARRRYSVNSCNNLTALLAAAAVLRNHTESRPAAGAAGS